MISNETEKSQLNTVTTQHAAAVSSNTALTDTEGANGKGATGVKALGNDGNPSSTGAKEIERAVVPVRRLSTVSLKKSDITQISEIAYARQKNKELYDKGGSPKEMTSQTSEKGSSSKKSLGSTQSQNSQNDGRSPEGERSDEDKKNISMSVFSFLSHPFLSGRERSKRVFKRVKEEDKPRREKQSSGTSTPSAGNHETPPSKCKGNCKYAKEKERKLKKENEKDERRRERDRKRILKSLDRGKKKVISYCTCEQTKWLTMKETFQPCLNSLRFCGDFCWAIFCPPWPSKIVQKAAFWPPARTYFFFNDLPERSSTVEEPISPLLANTIVRKAGIMAVNQKWRVGFEHPCQEAADRVDGIVLRTAHDHYIACIHLRLRRREPRYTLLYSHSNGTDLSDLIQGTPSVRDMVKYHECDVIAYDYSGYGISSGVHDEDNLYADIQAVWVYLTQEKKISPSRIVLIGYSIGTVATVYLASKCGATNPPAGVVLLAPMCSLVGALCDCESGCCCYRLTGTEHRFNNLDKIGSITVPILFVHGQSDKLVKPLHSKRLCEVAQTKVKPLWVPEGHHSNLENHREVWIRISEFLEKEIGCPTAFKTTPKVSADNIHIVQVTPIMFCDNRCTLKDSASRERKRNSQRSKERRLSRRRRAASRNPKEKKLKED